MIHNGIEYGLMQAYAEGFDILSNASAATLPPIIDRPAAQTLHAVRPG